MAIRLFEIKGHPDRIAVSSGNSYIIGGAFFLDFSRPVGFYRRWRILKWWFGPYSIYRVPVIHEGEEKGGYIIMVQRNDPCFAAILPLWKSRFPERLPSPTNPADGLKIIADFARQFPEFSKPESESIAND
jgi:hypothetical protein